MTERKSDADMILMLNERDPDVLRHISAQYGALIMKVSDTVYYDPESIEERIDDVLLDVWNTVPPAAPVSLKSYVAMLSRRRAIDSLRKATAEKRNATEIVSVEEELDEVEAVLTDEFDSRLISETLNRFLRELSPDNREIFLSRYFDLKSVRSIAKSTHSTENAVSTRLNRMRKKLKEMLNDAGVCV